MPFGTTFLALRGLLAAFPAAEVVVALVYWEGLLKELPVFLISVYKFVYVFEGELGKGVQVVFARMFEI